MQARESINKNQLLTILLMLFCSIQLKAQYSKQVELQLKQTETYPWVLSFHKLEIEKKTYSLNMINPGTQMGFICKWENKNDGKTSFPKRFRLGTLDYVNKLESKD